MKVNNLKRRHKYEKKNLLVEEWKKQLIEIFGSSHLAEKKIKLDIFESDLLLAQQLQEEEERREQEYLELINLNFSEKVYFKCPICLDPEVDIEDSFDTEHDDHKTCRSCATNYIQTKINEGKIPINCLCFGCKHELSESKCFEVLDQEFQDLYHHKSRFPTLDAKYRPCITPNCQGYDLPEENSTNCFCNICNTRWCCSCLVDLNTSQHKDISCELYQRWKEENNEGENTISKLVDIGLHDKEGRDRIRRCPKCKHPYCKDDKCNHVICQTGCGAHFCFKCANYYSDNEMDIYNHQAECTGYQEPENEEEKEKENDENEGGDDDDNLGTRTISERTNNDEIEEEEEDISNSNINNNERRNKRRKTKR